MGEKNRFGNGKKIARERIDILFHYARLFADEGGEQSRRCILLARRIAMKQRIRIHKRYRRQFCSNCLVFLVPGSNSRVRIQHGKVIVTCLDCGHKMRYPVVKQRAR